MNTAVSDERAVRFSIIWKEGKVMDVTSTSPLVNHFLDLVRTTRAHNTWVNYAHDLKLFFREIPKPVEKITRRDCLAFMKQQDQAGFADATINRRLAAVSALFNELTLVEPERFAQNPVQPRRNNNASPSKGGLYRRQPQRIPDIIPEEELRTFFSHLPTWRDRTLILLMWISCLRISEAVSIRFQDIECSRRSIHIPVAKWGSARTVYMDPLTFAAFNRYLDTERRALFPGEEHLFVAFKGNMRGCPLSVNAVQKMVKYYAERSGSPHLHAHLFRHTGITQLVQGGMPEPAIRKLVGHRHPDSLLPYLHLCDEFVEEEFAKAQSGLGSTMRLTESEKRGEA